MRYEITIKSFNTVQVWTGKDWAIVGEKEVDREPRYYSTDEKEPKTRSTPIYDYTPETSKHKTVERLVLQQNVETLDLAKVIKAINGLE